MMIIEEYGESLFIRRFEDSKRVINSKWRGGNFSYEGLRFLFEYLDEVYTEENPLKLDVIGLCCDFSEYKDLNEYLNDYSEQHSKKEEFETEEEFKQVIEEELNDKTTLIKFNDDLNEGFIIQNY